MKFTREQARPISSDTGLFDIEEMVREAMTGTGRGRLAGQLRPRKPGTIEQMDMRPAFVEHLLTYVDPAALRPLKVVVNPGNGGAGPVIDMLEPHLPLQFVKINERAGRHVPAGSAESRCCPRTGRLTSQAVLEAGADLGIAWDGDFDRCFFFDDKGEFVDGYYLVGLLAQQALKRHPGANIIHDPRLVWNTEELVRRRAVRRWSARAGTRSSRRRCAQVDAAYGGEMSAHHYFREFSYCDSGMIPWLQVVEADQRGRTPASRRCWPNASPGSR